MLDLIKKLREQSGAGMVDCKKALDEAGNDIEKALELLRKKGILKAAKRSDRETNEGVIKITVSEDGKTGHILQINSETDFVAKNDQFQAFAENVLKLAASNNPQNIEELLAVSMEDGNTIKDNLDNLSGVIGEKLTISKYNSLTSNGTIAQYSHAGGKIGTLVALDKENSQDLAKEVAMQVAAANPKYINPEDVDQTEIDKEKEIYKEQLIKEGKPENIIENILQGKINKYFTEVCLVKQEFVKEDKKSIEQLLGEAKVEQMIRYSLV